MSDQGFDDDGLKMSVCVSLAWICSPRIRPGRKPAMENCTVKPLPFLLLLLLILLLLLLLLSLVRALFEPSRGLVNSSH